MTPQKSEGFLLKFQGHLLTGGLRVTFLSVSRMEVTLSKTRLEFIETTGRLCQKVGLPRSVGQIYGLLYLSPQSLSLDDIAEQLSISKGSVSTGTRQLAGWQAIRQVWIPGDRRDYFEAIGDIRQLLESVYRNFLRQNMEKGSRRLEDLKKTLDTERDSGGVTSDEYDFCKARLETLGKFEGRLSLLLPLAEKMF